jgi:hypothetical protein
VVVRDHLGAVIVGLEIPEKCHLTRRSKGAEGLRVRVDRIRQHLQVESDCLALIKALRFPQPNRASWMGTITEIKEPSQLLPDYSFIHVRHSGNQVGHALAQLAMRMKQCSVLRASIPKEIAKLVKNDLDTSY